MKKQSKKKLYSFWPIVFVLLISGCMDATKQLISNPLVSDGDTNTINYKPVIDKYEFEGGTLKLSGVRMGYITEVELDGNTFVITKQSDSQVLAMPQSDLGMNLDFAANLFIASAYGDSTVPIVVELDDSSVTENKIAEGAVTAEKIDEEAVTLDKISTSNASDGDVMVYSRTQGSWIPAPVSGSSTSGDAVTSITIGNGLKEAGGDATITASGTIEVDTGNLVDQIVQLTTNNSDSTLPGYFEHNGLIRAYAIDETANGDFAGIEGQFSLVNTREFTQTPERDFRLKFANNNKHNLVIHEVIGNKDYLEFDVESGTKVLVKQALEVGETGVDDDDDVTATFFGNVFVGEDDEDGDNTDQPITTMFGNVVMGHEGNQITMTQGELHVDGEGHFEGDVFMDDELTVEQINGEVRVLGGMKVCSDSTNFSSCTSSSYDAGSGDFLVEGDLYVKGTSTTSNADYAEYFLSSEQVKPGFVVGIDLKTGLARTYRSGDYLLGVVSTKPGVLGNAKETRTEKVAVAIMGQVPVAKEQVRIENGIVYTLDNQRLGVQLASGDIYINLTTRAGLKEFKKQVALEKKIKNLEELVAKLIDSPRK